METTRPVHKRDGVHSRTPRDTSLETGCAKLRDAEEQLTQVLTSDSADAALTTEALLPLVYDQLRMVAGQLLAREAPGHTLQPTALVNEAFLRLVRRDGRVWDHRGHFFVAAGRAMRQILVDRARIRAAQKNGGGRRRVDLDLITVSIEPPTVDVLTLDDAIERLMRYDSRKADIVHLRYFAGMTVRETAEVLELSVGTIEREWRFIRAYLASEIAEPDTHGTRTEEPADGGVGEALPSDADDPAS